MSNEDDDAQVANHIWSDNQMTTETMYNGWTNYETWAVNLWITDDEGSCNLLHDLALQARADAPDCRQVRNHIWTEEEAEQFLLADSLEEFVEELNPLADESTIFSDLLGAALSEVNWNEIAAVLLRE